MALCMSDIHTDVWKKGIMSNPHLAFITFLHLLNCCHIENEIISTADNIIQQTVYIRYINCMLCIAREE